MNHKDYSRRCIMFCSVSSCLLHSNLFQEFIANVKELGTILGFDSKAQIRWHTRCNLHALVRIGRTSLVQPRGIIRFVGVFGKYELNNVACSLLGRNCYKRPRQSRSHKLKKSRHVMQQVGAHVAGSIIVPSYLLLAISKFRNWQYFRV